MMILFSSLILVLVHDPRYLYSVYQRKYMEWQLNLRKSCLPLRLSAVMP